MRIALHTRVRADRIEEYEAAHREVPEALTEAIRAGGVLSRPSMVAEDAGRHWVSACRI